MDTSEYMPMFLAEAQEHLQELNLAVVRLEEAPADRDTVEEIFRIAHSFKGMSATMGFSQVATLTHQMEDVFELLRQREEALPREVIDTLLACLDALEAAVESIESGAGEALDPELLIERLHGLVRQRTEQQEIERAGGRIEPDVQAAVDSGLRVLHAQVTLAQDVMMPSVRAHMVLSALSEHGELIGAAPTPDAVEHFEGHVIEGWLVTEHEESALEHMLLGISDVRAVAILEHVSAGLPAEPSATTEVAGAGEPAAVAPVGEPVLAESAAVAVAVAVASEAAPPVGDGAPAPATAAPRPADAAPAPGARISSAATRTVRVDAERLDQLMHSMAELVNHRAAVEALARGLGDPELNAAVQELTRTSQALQSMVMQVRMIPVDVVFLRFPRLVRDLSAKLGKEVHLELVGAETELDRTVVDALGDPLVHLVRNALDHGLEPSADRIAAGKPAVGTLTIAARHAGGSVVIEVRDDGRGIDPAAIARKAAEKGLIDPAGINEIDTRAAIELLFTAGFSTAETTNDISGRGVGMDAVRAKIRELGGEVIVESTLGCGTTTQIRLPLTLAIVSALLVEIGGDAYGIPLDRLERTLQIAEHPVQSVAGAQMLLLEDGVLPLLDASEVFGRPAADHEFAVIVRAGDRQVALAVDELVGQRELVTRPLPAVVSAGEPVSGGTALPDGRIALIVDCDAVVDPGGLSIESTPDLPAPARTAAAV